MTLARRLFAPLLAAGIVLAAAGAALADPALWVVQGPHAKVYLFGTIHVLRPSQQWRSEALDRALAESQSLWLEIPEDGADEAARQAVQQLGYDPTHPLSSKLKPADIQRVDAAVRALGSTQGEAVMEPMQPWLAAVQLSVLPDLKAGYAIDSGAEKVLAKVASAQGKPIHAFESMGEQLHFFADLPQDQQVALLDSTLDDIADATTETDKMVAAWARGDVGRLARLSDENLRKEAPKLYDILLPQRNRNWAAVLDQQLQGEGVAFVAVGAGHLAGSDSLQRDLEAKGYKVTRVQ